MRSQGRCLALNESPIRMRLCAAEQAWLRFFRRFQYRGRAQDFVVLGHTHVQPGREGLPRHLHQFLPFNVVAGDRHDYFARCPCATAIGTTANWSRLLV